MLEGEDSADEDPYARFLELEAKLKAAKKKIKAKSKPIVDDEEDTTEPSEIVDPVEVPALVTNCVKYIDNHGLDVTGIYRKKDSINKENILTLYKAFEAGKKVKLAGTDPHEIAALLKMYFAKLPDPIYTNELYPKFIKANDIEDDTQCIQKMRKLVKSLPASNRKTLKFFVQHLTRVVANASENEMTAMNISLSVGPWLLPKKELREQAHELLATLIDCYGDVFEASI